MRRAFGVLAVCLTLAVLVIAPGQVAAYHAFDPPVGSLPNLLWTDSPNPDVIDSVPKIAVADSGGTRYVYALWWHRAANWELRFARNLGEGSGLWVGYLTLASISMPLTGPEHTDIALAAYGSKVYAAWTEQPPGAPTVVKVASSTNNGQSFGPATTPGPDPNYNFLEPDLVMTDQYVYLARVRQSATSPYRVQLVRLTPSVIVRDVTANVAPSAATLPALAAHQSIIVVAYQECSVCSDPSTTHVWSRRSTNAGSTFLTAIRVSTGATTPSGAPDLASFGKELHIVWQAGTNVVYEKGLAGVSADFGKSWSLVTRFTIGQTVGQPDAESKYAVAAYGYAVAVVYRTGLIDPPSSRRNTGNGDAPGSWQPSEPVDDSPHQVREVDVAVDARHEISAEKGNVLQYVWSRVDGGTGRQDIAHRRIPTEERERQVALFSDFTEAQGQAAVLSPTSAIGYIFGGETPAGTDRIWSYDVTADTTPPQLSPYRLPSATGYASAIWDEVGAKTGAYVFGGRDAFWNPMNCVAYFSGSANAVCIPATLPTGRYATSAAFDGSRYAYVFGGVDANGFYLNEILRFDTETESFAGWGGCPSPVLPATIAFTSAIWDPVHSVAFVFGGAQPDPPNDPINYLRTVRFDPNAAPCPTATEVGGFPNKPWAGTTAVYAWGVASMTTVLVAGGRDLGNTIIGESHRDTPLIYAFDTVTYGYTLKFVDLPICKSYGSAIWYASDPNTGRFYYFGGYLADPPTVEPCGGGNQVIRYDLNLH